MRQALNILAHHLQHLQLLALRSEAIASRPLLTLPFGRVVSDIPGTLRMVGSPVSGETMLRAKRDTALVEDHIERT